MSEETKKVLKHIIQARIDNARGAEVYAVWSSVQYIMEYALADDIAGLSQFDYLSTREEEREK